MPVEVLGFAELPNVGDSLVQMENERAAKKLSEERQGELRQQRLVQPKKSRLEDMLSFVEGGQKAQLKLILRTDVQGSAEAIKKAIEEIESDKVSANFLAGRCRGDYRIRCPSRQLVRCHRSWIQCEG